MAGEKARLSRFWKSTNRTPRAGRVSQPGQYVASQFGVSQTVTLFR